MLYSSDFIKSQYGVDALTKGIIITTYFMIVQSTIFILAIINNTQMMNV